MLEGTEQRTERFLVGRKQSLDAFIFFFKQKYAGRAPFFTPPFTSLPIDTMNILKILFFLFFL